MIPEEEFKEKKGINLAPMVDFLFLILAVFAVMAVTRTSLYDSEVDLVKMDTQAVEEEGDTFYRPVKIVKGVEHPHHSPEQYSIEMGRLI